jgi:hypothetical protein
MHPNVCSHREGCSGLRIFRRFAFGGLISSLKLRFLLAIESALDFGGDADDAGTIGAGDIGVSRARRSEVSSRTRMRTSRDVRVPLP